MAFGAFKSANTANGKFIAFFVVRIIYELLVQLFVISVALEVNFCLPVTVDAPAHGKWRMLANNGHGINSPVTFFAFNFPYFNVLSMVKIGMIRQAVNPDPLNWLRI
jgi:hypothetical protein